MVGCLNPRYPKSSHLNAQYKQHLNIDSNCRHGNLIKLGPVNDLFNRRHDLGLASLLPITSRLLGLDLLLVNEAGELVPGHAMSLGPGIEVVLRDPEINHIA